MEKGRPAQSREAGYDIAVDGGKATATKGEFQRRQCGQGSYSVLAPVAEKELRYRVGKFALGFAYDGSTRGRFDKTCFVAEEVLKR